MKYQEKYWSYKAPPTPEFEDLPEGVFSGTREGWLSLSPGYRREIYRSAMKKVENSA
jgi:hypothetical protein